MCAQKIADSSPKMSDTVKILFVCLGNTCRSPMAEGIMRELVEQHRLNWEVDSAGLRSWNVGYFPEDRCLQVLFEHGIRTDHLGRELHEGDYNTFDYIFAMDEHDLEELKERCPEKCKAKIELLGTYIGRSSDQIIKDPFYEPGIGGFRRCYDQIYPSLLNFLKLKLGTSFRAK